MSIFTYIPLGFLIPFTNWTCWEVWGAYVPMQDRIYICEQQPNESHIISHEFGHREWFKELEDSQRAKYTKAYQNSNFKYPSVEEDFAEVYTMKYHKNKEIRKRIRLIKELKYGGKI